MNKCKILIADNSTVLERKINEFICDVKVISIDMEVNIYDEFYACIIYEEWSEC